MTKLSGFIGMVGGKTASIEADTAIAGTSQKEASELLNVSEDSIQRATKVKDSGVPELSEKVMSGVVAVSTAFSHLLTSHWPGAIFGNNRRAQITETFIHTLKRGEVLCRTAYTK